MNSFTNKTLLVGASVLLLSGCSPGFTLLNSTPSMTTHPSSLGEAVDCGSAGLVAAFSSTYWPVLKSQCVSCHGAGVTSRAFASSTLSEAYDSFRNPSAGGFKEAKVLENAVNPLHGSPATNGAFNKSSFESASIEWRRQASEACRTAPSADTPSTPQPLVTKGTVIGLRTQSNIIASYKSMLGVEVSDQTRLRLYSDHRVLGQFKASRRFLLPVKGNAENYTSATQMVTLVIATEHCNDLLTKESALAPASRTFYGDIDLNAASLSSVTAAQIEALTGRLAKRFWRRDPASDERQIFQDLYNELKPQGISSKQAMLLMCSMALSSVSSNVR